MNHVVIVGGGFAGLNCARKLAAYPDIRITLIDKNNFQQFQPLLYQVATAVLAPSNAAFSLRSVLRHHSNVDVKLGEAISVDLKTRAVETAEGQSTKATTWCLRQGRSQISLGHREPIRTHTRCTPFTMQSCSDRE